jgi:hypothetical protein
MPRTRKSAGLIKSSQDLKAVAIDIATIRAKSRALLASVGKDIRTVRGEVSALRKSGLVSKRIKAGSYNPTKYMLKKIERNRDVLRGDVIAVPAPKSVRDKYTHKGIFEQRGSTLIVPREYEKQRTKIKRGLVEISRDLNYGEEIRLILPFKATDMENLANELLKDPSFNNMKRDDELFGFRLFGHNMATYGFPSIEEFADHVLNKYQHLFSGKDGRQGAKTFELLRFKSRDSQLNESPEEGRVYSTRKKRRRGPTDTHSVERRLDRDADRKARERSKETQEERTKRLAYEKRASAMRRQRKFLDN